MKRVGLHYRQDTELSAKGENAPPLLDCERFIWGGGGVISTFGRVDYDLSTDIKGFDRHFVESKPGQRHRGITERG